MRRTLALAGAAVLAVGVSALPAPAAAGPISPDVVINEIAAELDPLSSLHNYAGSFVELVNDSGGLVELEGYTLEACDATSGPYTLAVFDSEDEVLDGETFIIANDAFATALGSPGRDAEFVSGADLSQSGGGVQLVETSTSAEDTVQWSSPPSGCQGFDDVGVDPDDNESINRGAPWFKATPTPEPAS
jgi:hypothetical protein